MPLFSDSSRSSSDWFPRYSSVRSKLNETPSFSERFRSFSPSVRRSGEDILRDLKDHIRKEKEMFFNEPERDVDCYPHFPSTANDSDDWARHVMDFRSRHPEMRVPSWISEDGFCPRMPQPSHWATLGRCGPQGSSRERRNSGGSAMSGTSEDDSSDACHTDKMSSSSGSEPVSHEIPIRIEAELPDSYRVAQEGQKARGTPVCPRVSQIRKEPQFATRTSPSSELEKDSRSPRDERCSSAPPDVPEEPSKGPRQQRFVSKISISPKAASNSPHPQARNHTFPPGSPFNSVPKPFVPQYKQENHKTPPEKQSSSDQTDSPFSSALPAPSQCYSPHPSPPTQNPHNSSFSRSEQDDQSHSTQRPSIVRNIPILLESQQDDKSCEAPKDSCSPSKESPSLDSSSEPDERKDLNAAPPPDVILEKISAIRKSVDEYKEGVKEFSGYQKDKMFLYLDEMLTRAMLMLDDIDPDGRDDVRQARRALIKDINSTLVELEKKVTRSQCEEEGDSVLIEDASAPPAAEDQAQEAAATEPYRVSEEKQRETSSSKMEGEESPS